MDLSEKQFIFAELQANLVQAAKPLGLRVKMGEAWRSPFQAARNAALGTGIAHSLHTDRLAVDLLLFKDGIWLTDSADYKPLGDIWKSWSTPDYTCCWGGDFNNQVDGNHFSIEHEGRK